jgi:osmotically-inducible protein OsmY
MKGNIMKTRYTTIYLLVAALMAPVASYADTDTNMNPSPAKVWVKDSVITTKIKAQLAAEKLPSLVHIKVATDSNGFVQLKGTAKTQTEIDKAESIAKGVEGVTFVENDIHLGKSHWKSGTTTSKSDVSGDDQVETRIKAMHQKLAITPEQEAQWALVADVMRDNDKQMEALAKTRAEKSNLTAVENLESYGEITDEHADGIKRFTPVFAALYDEFSDAQKKNADAIFSHKGHEHRA